MSLKIRENRDEQSIQESECPVLSRSLLYTRIKIRIKFMNHNKQSEPSTNWHAQLLKSPIYRDLEITELRKQEHPKHASLIKKDRNGNISENILKHRTQCKDQMKAKMPTITEKYPQAEIRNRKHDELTSLTKSSPNLEKSEESEKSLLDSFKDTETIKTIAKHITETPGEQDFEHLTKKSETNTANHSIFLGNLHREKIIRKRAVTIAGNIKDEEITQELLESSLESTLEKNIHSIGNKILGITSKSLNRKISENHCNNVSAEISRIGISPASSSDNNSVPHLKLILAELVKAFATAYENSRVTTRNKAKLLTAPTMNSGTSEMQRRTESETYRLSFLDNPNKKDVKNIFGKKVLSPESAEEQEKKRAKASMSLLLDDDEDLSSYEDDNMEGNEHQNNQPIKQGEGAYGVSTEDGTKDTLDTRIDEIDNELEQNAAQDRIDEANRKNAVAEAQAIAMRAEDRATDMERKYHELLRNMNELKKTANQNNNGNQAGTSNNNNQAGTSYSTTNNSTMSQPPTSMNRSNSRTDPNMIGTSDMVVMHRDYPARLVDDAAFSAIEKKLNATAARHALSKSKIKVIIDGIVNKQGAIIVSCRTPGTADWIKSIADKVLDMHACSMQDARLEPAFMIWVPDNDATFEDVVNAFRIQDIEVQQWSLLKAFPRERRMGRRFIILAGDDLVERTGGGQLRVQYLVYRVKATVYQLGIRTNEENQVNRELITKGNDPQHKLLSFKFKLTTCESRETSQRDWRKHKGNSTGSTASPMTSCKRKEQGRRRSQRRANISSHEHKFKKFTVKTAMYSSSKSASLNKIFFEISKPTAAAHSIYKHDSLKSNSVPDVKRDFEFYKLSSLVEPSGTWKKSHGLTRLKIRKSMENSGKDFKKKLEITSRLASNVTKLIYLSLNLVSIGETQDSCKGNSNNKWKHRGLLVKVVSTMNKIKKSYTTKYTIFQHKKIYLQKPTTFDNNHSKKRNPTQKKDSEPSAMLVDDGRTRKNS